MNLFNRVLREHIETITRLANIENQIHEASKIIIKTLTSGGKILLCGNGGSAADAQHIAAELMVRYKADRAPIPAIALTTDTSIITAHSNDYEFETVFSRQVMALANSGDCLIAISTSGNSKNIIKAAISAKEKKCSLVSLSGESGGKIKEISDVCICVPSNTTARIQESHILIGHYLCEVIDDLT